MRFNFFKNFSDYEVHDRDYWRARLIFQALLLIVVTFGILFCVNWFLLDNKTVAFIDLIGVIIPAVLYVWFRKSGNVRLCTWALSIFVTLLLSAYLIVSQGLHYSMLWATTLPPLTFFLLGRRGGTIFSVYIFCLTGYLGWHQYAQQAVHIFSYKSLMNIAEIAVVHILIFRLYERTRESANRQIQIQQNRLSLLALTDQLTGLYNRSKFESAFEDMMKLHRHEVCALVILDIDHFKTVNDKYGHNVGDKVLKGFGDMILADIRHSDVLARWGGEEFVALLPFTSIDSAYVLVERWRKKIACEPIEGVAITISAGVTACYKEETLTATIERADAALYLAKEKGRNKVEIAV
ncbi:GGDEF domain-containing protein [Aestuariibacter sp. A3R04]|uniref:GGDEF domain-containing protein n=1 Tax=Aestuariibacter sp. A3R04 TaxID=2841571 RepID=UPI001C0A47FF|nr:GGDEF domain-containing protein [Aestuariibacter sp. A3R04]MBU3023377.1 GGDEF domain-containing protein [Aestuariibacter sp. A3R04]